MIANYRAKFREDYLCDVFDALNRRMDEMEMSKPAAQRLEVWMKEITDLLCYQPEVPLAHKTCIVDAMTAFQKEVNPHSKPTTVTKGEYA